MLLLALLAAATPFKSIAQVSPAFGFKSVAQASRTGVANSFFGIKSAAQGLQMLLLAVLEAATPPKSIAQVSQMLLLALLQLATLPKSTAQVLQKLLSASSPLHRYRKCCFCSGNLH